MPDEIRARHAHHKAEVGEQPVVRAQHRRPQRVPGSGAMPPLKTCQRFARHASADRLEDALVRAFLRRHAFDVRLIIVAVTARRFEFCQRRQHQADAEAPCQPDQRARAPRDCRRCRRLTRRAQLVLPVSGVLILGFRQPPIDLCQLRLRLFFRQRPVERRTVNFFLPVFAVLIVRVCHHSPVTYST